MFRIKANLTSTGGILRTLELEYDCQLLMQLKEYVKVSIIDETSKNTEHARVPSKWSDCALFAIAAVLTWILALESRQIIDLESVLATTQDSANAAKARIKYDTFL